MKFQQFAKLISYYEQSAPCLFVKSKFLSHFTVSPVCNSGKYKKEWLEKKTDVSFGFSVNNYFFIVVFLGEILWQN